MSLILNHSFHVADAKYATFIPWLHNYMQALNPNYTFSEMVMPVSEAGSKTLILQYNLLNTPTDLEDFLEQYQHELQLKLYVEFHNDVLCLVTLMKQLS